MTLTLWLDAALEADGTLNDDVVQLVETVHDLDVPVAVVTDRTASELEHIKAMLAPISEQIHRLSMQHEGEMDQRLSMFVACTLESHQATTYLAPDRGRAHAKAAACAGVYGISQMVLEDQGVDDVALDVAERAHQEASP